MKIAGTTKFLDTKTRFI